MENKMRGFQSFYYGKKILLTGHTGFKGSWLSLMLTKLGADICGYALPLEKNTFYESLRLNNVYHNEGDITDFLELNSIINYFCPEIVIHFASHSSLNHSMQIPDRILRTNIMGVLNLLESVRKINSVKVVLVVTSDKCYKEINSEIPYKEDRILWGYEPYGTSKVCQELLTDCYRNSFFQFKSGCENRSIAIATARASNIVGGGDDNDTRLIPYLLKCFSKGEIARLRNPDAIRPWQGVFDVLYGYLLLVKKLYDNYGINEVYCEAFNFGPGKDGFISVKTVTELLSLNFEKALYEFEVQKNHPNEAEILKLDSTKAESMLNWKRMYSVPQMLTLTADFTQHRINGDDMRKICDEYVDNYMTKVNKYEKNM